MAITGMAVRGRRAAQNGLRRDAAADGGEPEWLLNMRLFPFICVSEAPYRALL